MNTLKEPVKHDVDNVFERRRADPDLRGVDLNTKGVPFNHNLQFTGKQIETADKILQECIAVSQGTKYQVSGRIESKRNARILLANLITNKRPKSTIVGLNPNWWKQDLYTRGGDSTRKIIYALEKLGYITINRGFKNRQTGMGRLSRLTPTKKLIEACPQLPNGVVYDPVQVVIMKGRKPVIVDENGHEKEGQRPLIEYDKKHKVAQETERRLRRANNVNSEAELRQGTRNVSPFQHAVFTENFGWGGRLYVKGYHHLLNYQQLEEKERAEITINGDTVVELDYSGLHPRLLYASEGYEYPLDKCPYRKINNDPSVRQFMKMIFLPMINAADWASAEKAANDWLWKFPRKDRNGQMKKRSIDTDHFKLQRRLSELGITKAGPLMERFMLAHKPIAKYLCNGSETGLELMNKDGKIALDVVDYFARNGKPILAVHDSFIVQKQYRKRLKYAMNKAYQNHNHGFTCPIK